MRTAQVAIRYKSPKEAALHHARLEETPILRSDMARDAQTPTQKKKKKKQQKESECSRTSGRRSTRSATSEEVRRDQRERGKMQQIGALMRSICFAGFTEQRRCERAVHRPPLEMPNVHFLLICPSEHESIIMIYAFMKIFFIYPPPRVILSRIYAIALPSAEKRKRKMMKEVQREEKSEQCSECTV